MTSINTTHYIYTLSDPNDGRLRYVGQTKRNPQDRYKDHCKPQYDRSHRAHWLNYLHALHMKPILLVIEVCDETNWKEREVYWIAFYRSLGSDLVNNTLGGDGVSGYRHTEETKEKIRLSMVGRNAKEKNPNWGRVWSADEKKQRSELMKGRKGHKPSIETKNKLRLLNIGENNPKSKLSTSDVLEIKQLLCSGVDQKTIARQFKVHKQTIHDIFVGRTWSWL